MSTPQATPAGSMLGRGPVGGGAAQQSATAAAPPRPAGPVAPPVVGKPEPVSIRPSRSERRESDAAPPRRVKGAKRPPRLASLQLKRIDPWTVLKISLIVAIVMFFVWMIAVGVLYVSLGQLNVWDKINKTWAQLASTDTSQGTPQDLIRPGVIFAVTAVIGAVNIVLFTALATLSAFVYNAAAGMSGGVEITLGERD